MNLKLLITAGLIALLIGLIVRLPAPVAAGWVESQVPGLRLTGVSGTALAGRVQYLGFNEVTLENVRWQMAPLALLAGQVRAALQVSTDAGSISGDFSHSLFGNTRVQNLNGSASLAWLGGLAGYRFVPLDGLLRLQDVAADLEAQNLAHAQGQVLINNAIWLLMNPPVGFGNFSAAIESHEQGYGLQVNDSDGPLAVEGGARLANNNSYTVDIRVRARAGADARLKKLLSQLGRPDASGWYRLKERGNL